MKYLFRHWYELKKNLYNKYLMLFLDYDGTLSPIVGVPERARISRKVKKLLQELSKSAQCKLAIVSGRALEDIKNMIGLNGIIYSGNHGLEIEGPRIRFRPFVPARYLSILRHIKTELENRLSSIKGVIVEDKGLSLALHYRLVPRRGIVRIKRVFQDVTAADLARNDIKIKKGKMVLEVRPPIEWDKGRVVLWLLARQNFASIGRKRKILPIYLGDDLTDEDAFKVLKNRGITIFVGRPKRSHASYYLKDVKEVRGLLRRILILQKNRSLL